MGVDETSLDRIRSATFPTSRRGYDKHEVEKFLARLADWLETGGGGESRSETVKRELERVGERTGAILSQAEESAQQIRSEAEQLAREVTVESTAVAQKARTEADAYAEKTRREADVYANETRRDTDEEVAEIRSEAEEEARETITEAQAQAARLVEAGTRRRDDIQAAIADLLRRRDEVLEDIGELSSRLRSIVGEQQPAEAEPVTEAYDVADALEATAGERDDVPGKAGPDDPPDEEAPEEASKPNPSRTRKIGY
ncbi:MAG: hypothetical protein K0S15_1812 [Solirubrobacterales bacterium]|jgi:DivIVA domain-containing protein|nr:hypothetical protein [Solirubrobacterales bacterium]